MKKQSVSGDSSFVESIIVPFGVYQKFCKVPEKTELKEMPVDLKVKLADQNEWTKRQVGSSAQRFIESNWGKRKIADLKQKINIYHPFLNEILTDYIHQYPKQIDWQPQTYEMILDGQILPKTNILRSLHFLLAPEALDYREPFGTEKLHAKLLELGVSSGWLFSADDDNKLGIKQTPKSIGIDDKPNITPLSKSGQVLGKSPFNDALEAAKWRLFGSDTASPTTRKVTSPFAVSNAVKRRQSPPETPRTTKLPTSSPSPMGSLSKFQTPTATDLTKPWFDDNDSSPTAQRVGSKKQLFDDLPIRPQLNWKPMTSPIANRTRKKTENMMWTTARPTKKKQKPTN